MKLTVIVALPVILQYLWLCEVQSKVDIVYLDEICGKDITIATDVVFHWTRGSIQLPAGKSCTVDIGLPRTDPQNKVIVYFSALYIDPVYNVLNCRNLSLHLTVNGINKLGPFGQCDSLTVKDTILLGGIHDKRLFSYHVGNTTPAWAGNFTFIFTSVARQHGDVDCPNGYFHCVYDKQWCVKDAVVCNGYPDCGLFKSDERDCSGPSKIPYIAGGVGGLVALISIGICIGLILMRQRTRETGLLQSVH